MRYFIIAGEASGDLHGANLIKELKPLDKEAVIEGWGGDMMAREGATIRMHYRSLAIMGFLQVVLKIGRIIANLKKCKSDIIAFNPDVIILIDYPGFNLRIAKFAKSKGYKVYYFISPKVWAWKESRTKSLKEFVDRLYIIFPFEIEYFAGKGVKAYYFGNPLADIIQRKSVVMSDKGKIFEETGLEDKPVIAIVPGSRRHEISHNLPVMMNICKYFPDYQIVITGVSTIPESYYRKYMSSWSEARLLFESTYEVISVAEAALVTSGTATLETALLGTPQVVCYKADNFSYQIAKRLVKVRFISLVNLIMDKEIVKELLQNDLNEESILRELRAILKGGWKRGIMLNNYRLMSDMLGEPGITMRIATDMVTNLKKPS